MKNILIIDTSESKEVKIELRMGLKHIILVSEKLKSQNTLPLIKKALRINKLSLKDISEIKVKTGPGSFTGLRVGIAIANSLAFLLKIPVNGKKIGDLEKAVYN